MLTVVPTTIYINFQQRWNENVDRDPVSYDEGGNVFYGPIWL